MGTVHSLNEAFFENCERGIFWATFYIGKRHVRVDGLRGKFGDNFIYLINPNFYH